MPELGEQLQKTDSNPPPNQGSEPSVDPFSRLLQLSERYGSQDKIPLDALEAIGYKRVTLLEGGTKLTPIAPREEKVTSWTEKRKKVPFGEIPVHYTSAEKVYRFIPEQDIDRLKKKMERIDFWNYFQMKESFKSFSAIEELDETSPLLLFGKDFREFLQSTSGQHDNQLDDDMIEEIIFKTSSIFPLVGHVRSNIDCPNIDDYIEIKEDEEDRSRFLSREKTKVLYGDLDRVLGNVDDVPALEKLFQQEMGAFDTDTYSEAYPELMSYASKNNIDSPFAFTVHYFSQYLASIGQTEFSKQIDGAQNLEEVRSLLKETSFSKSILEEEKILNKRIRAADIEGKKALSRELKSLRERKKKLQQLQFGMQQFFSMPEYISELLHRVVNDTQDSLVLGNSKDNATGFLYLDGRPDANRDRNPGKISGDCTEGRPLPFTMPEVPAFNIKVFDEEKKYFGNIYLLVTKDKKGNPVWHIDAIQIPKSTLDWDVTVASLVDSMIPAAIEKGMLAITVNSDEQYISNYDYIQEAVLRYASGNSHGRTKVDMLNDIDYPNKDEKYSTFQGTGEALVLWEQPEVLE